MAKSRRRGRRSTRSRSSVRVVKRKITDLKKNLSLLQKSLKTKVIKRRRSTRRGRKRHHKKSSK